MDHSLSTDLRIALRSMLKRRGVTALLLLTLGLGLGVNVAMFSVVDAILLRPLDFPNLPRLVRIWETSPTTEQFDQFNVAPANLLDWKAQSGEAFENLLAIEYWDTNLRGYDAPERVQGFRVSPGFFEALGVVPARGRSFLGTEGREGENRRVILEHGLWQRSFGGDPAIVGRAIIVDGEPHEVVGVAPSGFTFPEGAEIWSPWVEPAAATAPRERRYLTAIGVLKPGVDIGDSRVRLEAIAKRIETQHPVVNKDRGVRIEGLSRGFEDPGIRPVLAFFDLGAALVLLIACVNVANFLLARGAERRREVALRQALGATRGRITRQLLVEGLLTSALSLIVALPVGAFAAAAIRDTLPSELMRFLNGWAQIDLDLRAILFGAGLAMASALLFSLAPARSASSPHLTEALKEGGRASTAGLGPQRGRNALVVLQISSALALVLVASLAARSAWRLIEGPQGYEPTGLLGLRVALPEGPYADAEKRRAFARSVDERLRQLPGATDVAYANVLPAGQGNSGRSIRIEGDTQDASRLTSADARSVSPEYFATMKLTVHAGRGLLASDSADAPHVAVVSRSFAEKYWPGLDPLGRRFQAGDADGPWVTVVGVSGDVIHQWFARRNHPTFYRPYAQDPRTNVSFVVRAASDPQALATEARRAVAAVDPSQPAYEIRTMRRSIELGTVGLRFVAGVMSSLSILALLLALSGVYGLMAYRVSLRTLEIGIRQVLGASRGDVLRLTMGQAARLTSLGLVAGATLGVLGGRMLSGVLQGAVTVDVVTVFGFTAVLGSAALLAAYVPARRSLGVDPTAALRAE